MSGERKAGNVLRLLRFAAGGALIVAAFTGAIGLDDSHQVAMSGLGFVGLLAAKIAHLV